MLPAARSLLLALLLAVLQADLAGQAPPSEAARLGEVEGARARDPRPNLLLLVTDDHPHDLLGCAGHPVLRTPHLDGLARDGVRFTHAFVTTPICAASRASILTGLPERVHGYTFGRPPLGRELVQGSYPALLRRAGYRVGFVGKLGVAVGAEERALLFESFEPGTLPYFEQPSPDGVPEPGRHLTERNVERALTFLRVADERPFCLSVSFQAPHAEDGHPDQYLWPAACDGLYRDAELPQLDPAEERLFASQPEFLRTNLNRERWAWRFDTPEKRDRMLRGYLRLLSAVDQGVGRLLEELERSGQRGRTVVLLMGDNGYFLGERGYAGKWTMHERSIRVPLLVHDPRLPAELAGRELDALVLNLDLAPTLLDLAGLPVPEDGEGRSLRPWLLGREPDWRGEVLTEHLWEHPRIPRTRGLRDRRWKYVEYLDHPEFVELYDLERDPEERDNLAGRADQAQRLARMRARCHALAGVEVQDGPPDAGRPGRNDAPGERDGR